MERSQKKNNQVVVYQTKSGAVGLKGDPGHDTVWATQEQIAGIFEIERSVATKHINNILKDKELDVSSVCAKFAHTGSDGKTYQVQFYNLDIILAVGYRANSKNAIAFRRWATKTLHEYIIDGFAINRSRIAKKYGSSDPDRAHRLNFAYCRKRSQAKRQNGQVGLKSHKTMTRVFDRTVVSFAKKAGG